MKTYGDESIVENIMNKMIWQGMTESQLIDSWGRPVARDQKIYKQQRLPRPSNTNRLGVTVLEAGSGWRTAWLWAGNKSSTLLVAVSWSLTMPELEQVPFGASEFADNPEPRCPCLLLLEPRTR